MSQETRSEALKTMGTLWIELMRIGTNLYEELGREEVRLKTEEERLKALQRNLEATPSKEEGWQATVYCHTSTRLQDEPGRQKAHSLDGLLGLIRKSVETTLAREQEHEQETELLASLVAEYLSCYGDSLPMDPGAARALGQAAGAFAAGALESYQTRRDANQGKGSGGNGFPPGATVGVAAEEKGA